MKTLSSAKHWWPMGLGALVAVLSLFAINYGLTLAYPSPPTTLTVPVMTLNPASAVNVVGHGHMYAHQSVSG